MDLRRQVSRKLPKKKANSYKKRQDRKFLQGRTYKDYQEYLTDNPDVFIVQMDTVYNDETNGPFIQTFKFLCTGILVALRHESKSAKSMKEGVDLLEEILGTELFRKYVHILVTDRGTEFSDADGMETGKDGTCRTRVFYCDPMQSGQKGSLENNHVELRYIFPKGTNLNALGLTDQDALNLALSHINSSPVEKLGGKSPLDLADFAYHDLYEKLVAFCRGIQAGSPIDSFVTPEPWAMPGYTDKVIMAAGAFTQGSSIELSCDGPLREPYTAYLQGGLTYESGKIGILSAAEEALKIL